MKALIKRVLPHSLLHNINRYRTKADKALMQLAAKHKALSFLYYLFFNRTFMREQYAVLQGRVEYWRALHSGEANSAMLRRNIHRLEKGMIMRPRKPVFAEGYISETVERFIVCTFRAQLSHEEAQWAKQVLTHYFAIVSSTPIIQAARERFTQQANMDDRAELTAVPYTRHTLPRSDVSYEQFKQLCEQRRSVRWFTNKPVDRALVEQAVAAARQAPSACNRQPFSFHLANQPELARTLGNIAMGTAGFAHNFQCLMVVVGDLSAYPYERDRHVIYIDASLASMQFMLALETLGLSSCVINWPDVEHYEKQMEAALGLTAYQRPIMLIAIGHADDDGMIPFSQKKSAKELIKEVSH